MQLSVVIGRGTFVCLNSFCCRQERGMSLLCYVCFPLLSGKAMPNSIHIILIKYFEISFSLCIIIAINIINLANTIYHCSTSNLIKCIIVASLEHRRSYSLPFARSRCSVQRFIPSLSSPLRTYCCHYYGLLDRDSGSLDQAT